MIFFPSNLYLFIVLSNWVIPEKIHPPPPPDGWHARNSCGRGVEGSGNLGRRRGLWTWKSGWEGGSSGLGNPGGRGGQKILPSVGGGGVYFF